MGINTFSKTGIQCTLPRRVCLLHGGSIMKSGRVGAIAVAAFFGVSAPEAEAQDMVIGGPLDGTIMPGPNGGMVIGGPLDGTIMPSARGGMGIGGPLDGPLMPTAQGGVA